MQVWRAPPIIAGAAVVSAMVVQQAAQGESLTKTVATSTTTAAAEARAATRAPPVPPSRTQLWHLARGGDRAGGGRVRGGAGALRRASEVGRKSRGLNHSFTWSTLSPSREGLQSMDITQDCGQCPILSLECYPSNTTLT
jgi:hypothetical protein